MLMEMAGLIFMVSISIVWDVTDKKLLFLLIEFVHALGEPGEDDDDEDDDLGYNHDF
jgi:hypothetical protein